MKFFLYVCALLAVLGFPREPFYGIPLITFVAPFFLQDFLRLFRLLGSKLAIFFVYVFLFLFIGTISWLCGDGQLKDLVFLLSIVVKMILCLVAGAIVYFVLERKPSAALGWLFTQIFLIIGSVLSSSIYTFLVGFISPDSSDVFSLLFGLRGLGFGVYHVDGAITMCFFIAYLAATQKFTTRQMMPISSLSWLSSILLARSAFVLILIRFFIKNIAYLFLFLMFGFLLAPHVDESTGAIHEALEPFRNILESGALATRSTDANLTMFMLPESVYEYFIGTGMFFSEEGFFRGTDLGWMRLSLFGGYFFTILFLILNVYWLHYVFFNKNNNEFRGLALFMVLSFFLINFKGLVFSGAIAFACFLSCFFHKKSF